MQSVSIITVNYNQPRVTEELLVSIKQLNSYPNVEIIVVDNGSRENYISSWQEKYPDVKFIRSEKNLGFAGGNNLGLKSAGGNYLFLVNNDTEFTSGLVEQLVHTLDQHPEIGMVSPKIRYFDQPEILQYAGFTPMNYFTARNNCIGQFEQDNGQYDNLTGKTGFIHGAAMMLRREAIIKAGFMAENYFLYYEEMDWCEKVRKAGFSIWVNTKALIYHKESVSVGSNSPLKEYFMNRNRILFIRRNGTTMQKIVFYCYFLTFVFPRNVIKYIKEKRSGFAAVLLKAIKWNLTHDINSPDTGYPITNIK